MLKTKSGFTIVELLIVIVVIGVLATITIIAYNGFQQRAKNANIITAVNAYKKAIQQYSIDNSGGMPYGTRSNICLGSGYTTNNTCGQGSAWGGNILDDDTTFSTLMTPYLPQEPVTGGALVTNGASDAIGVIYWASGRKIFYFLYGAGQTCTAGGTASAWGANMTQCDQVLTPAS